MTRGYDPQLFRDQLREVCIAPMFRVIHNSLAGSPLGSAPSPSRFSDPDESYGVLYAAATVRCCFWEAVIRDRLDRTRTREIPITDVEERLVVTLRSRGDLLMLDLRLDGPIRVGLRPP